MFAKLLVLVLALYFQCDSGFAQRQWISPNTTAAEMRNPYTWYNPFYQAAAEAYAQYYQNAREIRHQLWQQAYATGAFANGPNGRYRAPYSPYRVPYSPNRG